MNKNHDVIFTNFNLLITFITINFSAGWWITWVTIPRIGAFVARGFLRALGKYRIIPEITFDDIPAELHQQPEGTSWKISDQYFALPGILNEGVADLVQSKFTSEKLTRDIANLYDCCFPQMLNELKALAGGSLEKFLVAQGVDTSEPVSKNWDSIKAHATAVAESLEQNLGQFQVSNNGVEAGFADIQDRAHSNCTAQSAENIYADTHVEHD